MTLRTLIFLSAAAGAALMLSGCLALGVAGAAVGVAGAAVGATAKGAGAVAGAVIPGGKDKEKNRH